jgi:LCP family protein required for cell wall assembly
MSETAARRPGWVRRHKAAVILVALVVVLVGVVGGWAVYVNQQIGHVPRVDAGIQPATGGIAAEKHRAINILLAGTDSRSPGELAKLVRSGWKSGAMRSDTIMLLHITKDRQRAYLISIPRDTWAAVPGHGHQKINAAFSYGGPALYVDTIEKFTGLRVDHLAVIDWGGFKQLSRVVGGVDVNVPQTVYDPSTKVTWHEGKVHLEGEKALLYVRQRHNLPNGDFDRINRQQNFLRAMMAKLLSDNTLFNPVTLTRLVSSLTGQLTLDSTFSNAEVRQLALSLRGIRTKHVTFVTVPLKRYARIDGQSVNLVDSGELRDLFAAATSDNLEDYVRTSGDPVLPGPGQVH